MLIRNILCSSTSKLPSCTAAGSPQYTGPIATCWRLATSPSCGSSCLAFVAPQRTFLGRGLPVQAQDHFNRELCTPPWLQPSWQRSDKVAPSADNQGGLPGSKLAGGGGAAAAAAGGRAGNGWGGAGRAGGCLFSDVAVVSGFDLALRQAWLKYTISLAAVGPYPPQGK